MHRQPVPRLLLATLPLVVAVACAPVAPPTATGGAAKPAAQPAAQSGAPPAAQAIVLKGITAWVRDFPYNAGFWEFKRRLELNSNGSITIDWKGGPEAAPPFEQVGMVKAGVFDIVNTNGSYYTQLMPGPSFWTPSMGEPSNCAPRASSTCSIRSTSRRPA